ncbi:hypothetical protein DH2020_040581 [Rehmannia glutinosa]|uniref:Uncharacterized protein n=1 Tax=Rehmannia glutinosa TaxID=99300 RepID=A0ABR0USJ5_REHGL
MNIPLKEDLQILIYNYSAVILPSVIAIVVAVLFRWYLKGAERRKGDIPGKLGFPFLGETFSFLSATNSTKGYLKPMADAVGKKSLLTVPLEIHRRIRRLLSDPFSMNSMSKFVPKFDRELCERLKRKENEGKSFKVLDFTMKVAFDGICDMLASITDASTLEQLGSDITAVADAMLSFPIMIPGSRYYKGMKARKRVMETFMTIITKRRNGEEAPDDFLQSMLKRDSHPPNEKLEDEEILDNLLTLIIAGQSTTAAAIMWSEEQLSILRNKSAGDLLKYEDLMGMSYGSKVVKETLRMSNVLLWYPRVALEDCSIEGKFKFEN